MLPHSINWTALDETLERLTCESVTDFATAHSSETFYGIAFECDPFIGKVVPCLNTPENLERAVSGEIRPAVMMDEEFRRNYEQWADGNPDSAFATILPGYERLFGLNSGEAVPDAKRADVLRWGLPLWKYCDFANAAYHAGWQPFSDLLQAAARLPPEAFRSLDDYDEFLESFRESFLRSVCRVAIRLESSTTFDCLSTTPDFQVCVIDGEEASERDWSRLDSVRAAS